MPMSANDPKAAVSFAPSKRLYQHHSASPQEGMEMGKRRGGSTVSSLTAVRFEPCSTPGCLSVTSSCSRFSCSPLSYGAGGHLSWPSLHWWWVSPSGSDGNTHVYHGQPASSQEWKCAAAIPTPAVM